MAGKPLSLKYTESTDEGISVYKPFVHFVVIHEIWRNCLHSHFLFMRNSKNMNRAIEVSNFLIFDANDLVSIMEKESKSCICVLLRADLTGHDHPRPFCQKGVGRPCTDRSSLKRTTMQNFIFFNNILVYIKKLETYSTLFIFLDVRIKTFIKFCWEMAT